VTTFRRWIGTALVAVSLTGAALAGPPTIAPGDIRPGMTGYGLSVFRGATVDTFGVKVIGVQPNVRVGGSMILVEVSGHGLELSSIAQGMSGSPVFIEGRLAGALAFGWGGALKPIAGVTPIEEMFAVPAGPAPRAEDLGTMPPWSQLVPGDDGAAGLAAALFPDALPTPAPAPAPALPAGWPGPAAMAEALFAPPAEAGTLPAAWICRPAGATAAAGEAGDGAAPALVPGGACAVPLVLGDALLGAVGTVTWVQDGRVWLFGHPFMQRGPVDLPLAGAEILTTFPSRDMSFKMGTIGQVVGTVHRDQRAGLLGVLGEEPPLVPVAVRVTGPEGERPYAFRVADDPLLLPALVFWSSYNSLLAEGNDASLQTVRVHVQTRWDAPGALGHDGLAIDAVVDGPGGAAQLAPQLMAPLQILLNNPYHHVALRGVDVTVETAPGLATAGIVGLSGPEELPATGGPVTYTVELEPRRGARDRRQVTLDVPAGLGDGPYRVVAASAAELFALEAQRAAGLFAPASLDGIVRLLRSERSPGTLTVALFAPGHGVVVAGQELAALPGSVARTMLRAAAPDQRTLADTVARRDAPTPWILDGHALQDVRVGREPQPLTVEKRP